MKLFEKDCKINFVDEDSVFVGYDMCGQCCERFGWYIASEQTMMVPKEGETENDKDFC